MLDVDLDPRPVGWEQVDRQLHRDGWTDTLNRLLSFLDLKALSSCEFSPALKFQVPCGYAPSLSAPGSASGTTPFCSKLSTAAL